MNTRLQVEHPVTEMVTGLDLVALQIRVAQGEPLGFVQGDVRLRGHAIEVRLYAEDPARDFLPVTGRIDCFEPAVGEGVRIDAGIASGQELSPFYDPMLAKVIAWGETRDVAGDRLVDALRRTRLFGTTTNKGFLLDVLERPAFRRGEATTAFIAEETAAGGLAAPPVSVADAAIAAVLQYEAGRRAACAASLGISTELLNWSSQGPLESHFRYRDGDALFDVTVAARGAAAYEVRVGETTVAITLLASDGTAATCAVDGRRVTVGRHHPSDGVVALDRGGHVVVLRNELAFAGVGEDAAGGGRVVAPMHGVLLEVLVAVGERVEKGSRLAVLEAMKMHHELTASVAGTVTAVHVERGAQIGAGDVILIVEADA